MSWLCAGFVYGLGVAQGLIAAGTADSVLVVGTDTLSLNVDPTDPISMLFSDGASAVVLRVGRDEEPGALGACVLGSDGDGRDLITVRGGGVEERSAAGGAPADPYMRLEGREVFWRAVEHTSSASRAALDAAGLDATGSRLPPDRALDRVFGGAAALKNLRH
ncbi:hypothetical protein [Streptomyces sp. NPDC047097]|uniref:hypothetical protein n=1 Tax=Streptomyces sp. NPDC047097 TaxID=3155260 RepID=UPI0033F85636